MILPEAVRVRITSEGAEGNTTAPVGSQIMPMNELAAMVLSITGKDPERVVEILSRGSLVSEASRVHWEPFTLEGNLVQRLLSHFPDPNPELRFNPDDCTAVVLLGLPEPLTIDRDSGLKRRMFKRESFWERAMALGAATAEYKTYSYKARADVFAAELGPMGVGTIAEAAKLLAVPGYTDQIRRGTVRVVEYHVPRLEF